MTAGPGGAGDGGAGGADAGADAALAELAARAEAVQPRAYAPYSRFRVGAAIRAGGRVYAGVNVENAAFPVTVCAERNAIAAAILDGAGPLEAVAVCTDASPPSAPCGACRQVLLEHAGPDPAAVPVVAVNPRGERRAWTLAELIPHGFSGRELP